MNHLDLFSGIGGFAYAVDQVWENATHIFCEIDKFCQEVLKKHWPESRIYGDIRTITDTASDGFWEGKTVKDEKGYAEKPRNDRQLEGGLERPHGVCDFLTGGFPCQPFSAAGKRRGTADDRYLWPEMLRVIRLAKPTWIIGENVGGFVTWNEGMVLEQVCLDLEGEGYEVQPFIIPACAKNAPHRRDRVWIVANRKQPDGRAEQEPGQSERQTGRKSTKDSDSHATDTPHIRVQGLRAEGKQEPGKHGKEALPVCQDQGWDQNWLEVATRLCRVDDGVSRRVDRLRALGNAIVPQVAVEIMKAIKRSKHEKK